jgi:hypothetical protein
MLQGWLDPTTLNMQRLSQNWFCTYKYDTGAYWLKLLSPPSSGLGANEKAAIDKTSDLRRFSPRFLYYVPGRTTFMRL